MRFIGALLSLGLIALTLIDCFETILQPRRVTHRYRFARLFYRGAWALWRAIALSFRSGKRREAFLSVFGPFSLLGLFATWVFTLILGFGMLHWSVRAPLRIADGSPTLGLYLYFSGTTFFTLGYGDVTPVGSLGRTLAVAESGLGFGFLAVIISYLPVLSQAFSRREVVISLLDARAGSPPSAGHLLSRVASAGNITVVDQWLADWELWAAELLESHLSFPVLSYYRSQHDNQSWVAALATMLDTCAILIVEVKSHRSYQAQLTFAMARHAAVDLSLVLKLPRATPDEDRLPPAQLKRLREMLRHAGLDLHEGGDVDAKLIELRGMYEPFIFALARRCMFTLPPILPDETTADNWQRSAWMKRTPGIGSLPSGGGADEHFH